jgi:uncharacterized protein (DUF433 family)
MTLPEYLTHDADSHIHVTGHRIGLEDVVYYYNEGYSAEALLDVFPTLSLAVVYKVIAFYLEHRADVDTYVASCNADMERQRAAAPRGPDVDELRRRLAAKQAAGA